MASSTCAIFLFLFVFTFTFPTLIYSTLSFCASQQRKYWSQNVLNEMPASVLAKLSPLSEDDSQYFTALVSHYHMPSSNVKFCNLANLACSRNSSKQIEIQPLANGYNSYVSDVVGVEQVDPSSFFRLSILEQGKQVRLTNLRNRFPPRSFLPSQIASKISIAKKDHLQMIFPESFTNPQVKDAINTTFVYCNAPALKGEMKSCTNSIEQMIDFSKEALGAEHLIALTTEGTEGSDKELTIGKIKKIDADKIAACHEVFLPFATYFCHYLFSTRLYTVEVINPQTKSPVNRVIVVCHMDTSQWPRDHVAFRILKSAPGHGEVCHWMTENDLAWAAAPQT